jgi:UDPglucose 6-dehydrogenase
MHIGIIGTGYVGLVTGVCFAEFGVDVTCCDRDQAKISALKKGKVPFYEPGLEALIRKNVKNGRLRFTTRVADSVSSSLVVFIAVGTPPRGDGSCDLSYVEEVGREIGAHLDSYKVIVTKSTVPVGTGEKLQELIRATLKAHDVAFDVASNPAFLREGSAIEDFMRPNRVIIGSDSPQAVAILKDLYRPLYLIETPFVISDRKTAELIKYASNSFLATKISFINEMSQLCDKLGADVRMVARGMGLDMRIGEKFLHPGPGFGGSCFPKDTRAMLCLAESRGLDLQIIKAAVSVNEAQKAFVVKRMMENLRDGKGKGGLKGKTVAVLGLSFKPNTDDVREAPALCIIKSLLKAGLKVRAHDPTAMSTAKGYLPSAVEYATDPYMAMKGANAVAIITEWNEYRNLDLARMLKLMKEPFFFDLRNIYDPVRMREAGFRYFSIGRP